MDKSLVTIKERSSSTSRDRGGELRDRRDQAGHQGGRLRRIQTVAYWQVFHPNGQPYCQCGNEKDAWALCTMSEGRGRYYESVPLKMPVQVDVDAEDLGPELQLEGQKALKQSEWTVL